VKDLEEISGWCKTSCIDLVVVGPEDPLAAGLAEHLTEQGRSEPCIHTGFFLSPLGMRL